MPYYYKSGIILTLLLSLVSCNKDDNDYTAYFGGEIADPKVPYVLFSKNSKVIDTIPLDKNNRFFIKFDSLTPGLYSFKHEPDYQYVYFDKNDSLMVSVNTTDFDESVMFSGRGERKNNFMMELFLANENDRNKSYGDYDYEFSKFSRKADSAYAVRKAFYEKKKENIKWSEGFDFYARARVDFNYFTKKEYYPYIHTRRTGKEAKSKLPANFYDYRKDIDFNDARLTNFSPFARYLTAMLNNMAITRGQTAGVTEENSLRDNITKLKIADSMFSDEEIRNQVLNSIAFTYLLEDQNMMNNQKFLEQYRKLSTDNSEQNEIKKISEAIRVLKAGSKLPSIVLVDKDNVPVDLNRESGKQTVIFFWTSCAKAHMEMVYEKVTALKKLHPATNFIAVNVDGESEWKKSVNKINCEHARQLRAVNFQALKDKWVFTKINRTIILNADGTIKNAFTNLTDSKFADYLK